MRFDEGVINQALTFRKISYALARKMFFAPVSNPADTASHARR
jgi:hypothetical protein